MFVIAKTTSEILNRLEGETETGHQRCAPAFTGILIQIVLLDVVFSLASVTTAVAWRMSWSSRVTAVVIGVACMMAAAGPITRFVERHPTVPGLALSFLLLIGFSLIAEGSPPAHSGGFYLFRDGFSQHLRSC